MALGKKAIRLVLGGFVAAATATGVAQAATTLQDTYYGGTNTYNGGDVIGDPSIFDIMDAVFSRPDPGQLKITIDTNYAGKPGTPAALGTGYGALFFTPGANAWQPSGVGPTYATDQSRPGEWSYAFVLPQDPAVSSGSGSLYSTGAGTIIMSNADGDPVTYPYSGNNGFYFRQGQAVQFAPDGGLTPAAPLAGGSWSVAPGAISVTIADGGLLGDDFAFSWGETCGNDVIAGQVTGAPEPAAWALMLFGVGAAGQALRRRRRRWDAQFA